MEPETVGRPKRPPSAVFKAFAASLGPVIETYDPIGQLILYPSLIAARGRAHSFATYTNRNGDVFADGECHYVEGSSADAFATRKQGQFCFAVYDAVAFQMLDLFSLAFATPGFFREIGDCSKEDALRVSARTKPAGYGFFRKTEAEPIRFQTELAHPLCPARQQAALYFTGLAMDGVWTHELAHAFMGHLDFADRHLGVRAMSETPNDSGDLRQMPLEAEADRFSAATLVQSAFAPSPYLPIVLKDLSPAIRVKAGFVVSAILTWFWAFQQRIERNYDGVDPYGRGTHPPPLARLHLGFDGAREMLQTLKMPVGAIQAATFDAMSELQHLGEAKDWFSILDPKRSFSKEALVFVKDIKTIIGDTFITMRDDLEPYRYLKPLP